HLQPISVKRNLTSLDNNLIPPQSESANSSSLENSNLEAVVSENKPGDQEEQSIETLIKEVAENLIAE
uniref:Uncharacterized protein n=1 Tax=Acrobeloides nanus TaxID=290746 RepID=A0A914DH94_9BILA